MDERRSSKIYWLAQRMADVPRHNDWLTPAEQVTLASLKVVKRRGDWRLGRWTAKCALRTCFAETLGTRCHNEIEIRAAGSGAPVVFIRDEPAPVGISISHSNGVGLCVVSDLKIDVGCDAELVESRSDAFVTDVFSLEERVGIARVSPDDRPFLATLIWSAKESVLKVLREGLRRDTRSVVVDVGFKNREDGDDNWNIFTARCADGAQSFSGWWLAAGPFVYTVAARGWVVDRAPRMVRGLGCRRNRRGSERRSSAVGG